MMLSFVGFILNFTVRPWFRSTLAQVQTRVFWVLPVATVIYRSLLPLTTTRQASLMPLLRQLLQVLLLLLLQRLTYFWARGSFRRWTGIPTMATDASVFPENRTRLSLVCTAIWPNDAIPVSSYWYPKHSKSAHRHAYCLIILKHIYRETNGICISTVYITSLYVS